MKCLYWNFRALANSPTKLALKKLLVKFKHEICFISEPWIPIANLSQRWLHNLGFKTFAVNCRNQLLPNLRCLCASHLSPTLLDLDNQQIYVKIEVGGKYFVSLLFMHPLVILEEVLVNNLVSQQSNRSVF